MDLSSRCRWNRTGRTSLRGRGAEGEGEYRGGWIDVYRVVDVNGCSNHVAVWILKRCSFVLILIRVAEPDLRVLYISARQRDVINLTSALCVVGSGRHLPAVFVATETGKQTLTNVKRSSEQWSLASVPRLLSLQFLVDLLNVRRGDWYHPHVCVLYIKSQPEVG